jgi:hypothetical protein
MSRVTRNAVGMLLCSLLLAGTLNCCAAHRETPGVPIDERPRPPQPPAGVTPVPPDSIPVPPPRVMTPSGEENLRALAVRDTAVASRALKRCAGKTLLPEMESTYAATVKLLEQTRDALARGDFRRARSLARNATQLATSLDCP